MARKIEIKLVGDERDLLRAYNRAGAGTTSFGNRISRTLSGIAKAGVFAGVTAGVVGVTAAVRAGISEWSESAKVAAQTRAELKSTGGVANVTARDIDKLAGSLMRKTGIDDEQIKTSANLLLTFKQIRNEVGAGNRIFDQATVSALNLSRAGFGSIESTSKMLGKALNDPVRGMTALGRAGVTFSEDQKKAIKALAETGHTLEAQKLLLREVESQVGGSAEAYGRTLPGMLSILRETLNNVAGDIVARYVPAFQAAVREAVDWVSNADNQKRVIREVSNVIDKAIGFMRGLIQFTRIAGRVMSTFSDAVGGAKNAVYLLGTTIAAVKFTGLIAGLATTRDTAGPAARNVGLLLARLRLLGAIGTVAVTVDIIFNAKGGVTEKAGRLAGEIAGKVSGAVAKGSRLFGGEGAADIVKKGQVTIGDSLGRLLFADIPDKVSGTTKTAARHAGEKIGKELAEPFRLGLSSGITRAGGLAGPNIPGAVGGTGRFGGALAAFNKRQQFRALGLTSTGDELAPTRLALWAEANKLEGALSGTMLDNGKTRSIMRGIRKVLSGELGGLGRDMRLKIREIIGELEGELGGADGPLTKLRAVSTRKLTEGLDMSAATRRAFRQRIAGAHLVNQPLRVAAAGTGGMGLPMLSGATTITININGHEKDARQIAREVKVELQKMARRTTAQTSGHFAGNPLRFG